MISCYFQGYKSKKLKILAMVCLFDLILYVPSTIFQLNRDRSSWVEPVLSLDKCVLLKDHNAVTPVRLKPVTPRSRVKHSTTEPLRSHNASYGLCVLIKDYLSKQFSLFHPHVQEFLYTDCSSHCILLLPSYFLNPIGKSEKYQMTVSEKSYAFQLFYPTSRTFGVL